MCNYVFVEAGGVVVGDGIQEGQRLIDEHLCLLDLYIATEPVS